MHSAIAPRSQRPQHFGGHYDVRTELDPYLALDPIGDVKPLPRPADVVCHDCGRVMRPHIAYITREGNGNQYLTRCPTCHERHLAAYDSAADRREQQRQYQKRAHARRRQLQTDPAWAATLAELATRQARRPEATGEAPCLARAIRRPSQQGTVS